MKTKLPESKHVKPKAAPQPAESPEPFHIRKILVPTDFSEPSKKALAYARAFAGKFGAEIVLVHVMEPLPYSAYLGYGAVTLEEPYEIAMSAAKASLKSWSNETRDGQPASRSILRTGTPHHEIVLCAREIRAEMIILGTHGHSGLDHLLLGSVAERVVRHAPCPVLVVRDHEREFVASA